MSFETKTFSFFAKTSEQSTRLIKRRTLSENFSFYTSVSFNDF